MVKKIAWHLELALLRRHMRGLHDSPARPVDSELARFSTGPADLASGLAPLFRETTAFTDLD